MNLSFVYNLNIIKNSVHVLLIVLMVFLSQINIDLHTKHIYSYDYKMWFINLPILLINILIILQSNKE
jgi:hypothetical protein